LRSTTIVTRLTEPDDVIKSLLRRTPRLGLALVPASAGAGPINKAKKLGKVIMRKLETSRKKVRLIIDNEKQNHFNL